MRARRFVLALVRLPCYWFEVLPFNTTAPLEVVEEHRAAVEQLRSLYPQQTLDECTLHHSSDHGSALESVEEIHTEGACGLKRLTYVMLEVSKFQARFGNTTKGFSTNVSALHLEYGERRDQMVQLRRMLRPEVGVMRSVCGAWHARRLEHSIGQPHAFICSRLLISVKDTPDVAGCRGWFQRGAQLSYLARGDGGTGGPFV